MSAVKPLYLPQLVTKKRAAFMGKAPGQGEWVWLLLENPNSPEGFSIAFLKARGGGGGGMVAGPVISCAQLWFIDGEIKWWCHRVNIDP